ncbi:type VII secretion protein EccCa [Streptacidiphilus fuscans]|uniref:Type VII secretion protein EccCa n=1 Tax=Streptacidiphilus fuscans TaxID=2789292 RepID=A0A931BE83_9ACTN|nr:type VII secretion protein EccCa [Streptacidiphilus fuscans]MBF9072578.1 type VII secretion protein EccCa [Streptacidiphilus fuscans]
MPEGEIQLQEPPPLPEPQSAMSSMMQMAPMALGSLSMVFMFLRPGGSGGAMSWVAIGMMGLSAVGMLVVSMLRGAGDRKRQLKAERRDYLRYLSQMRKQVRKTIAKQQEAQAWRHPVTDELAGLVRTTRLWERRTQHPDFSDVRIGTGPQRLAAKLAPLATKPVEDLEPLTAHALRRFIHAYGTLSDQPIAIYLRGFSHLLMQTDDVYAARAMVRAMVAQLSVFHSPEELRVAVVADDERREEWEWAKWLPHALHPTDTDGAGAVRLVAGSVLEVEQLLGEEFGSRPPYEADAVPNREEPFTVLIVDGPVVPATSRAALTGYRNAILVDLSGGLEFKHAKYTLRLRIQDGTLSMVTADRNRKDQDTELGRPDGMSLAAVSRLAVLMAPYRIGDSADTSEPLETDFDLTALLGIPDLYEHDVAAHWAKRTLATKLRIPIGLRADGQPVDLDIKESAQGGMGPHGMLIGATGSGKSELLRTLVLALALTHSSEMLNFVLVDFKGGATFLGLDGLPHTSAVITNLADEAHLVDRMRDSLHGEMVRRQELLRAAGNYSSLLEYETARLAGAPLDPMPSLFVVVDEFSELLAAHRDFMELFVMIGRLGRSLGVHLLLASQRLDEGRMTALESHLSYRIGLRTFSAMESRGVLGVPDAYHLPSQPGNGFLRSDISTLSRFKAAYVSGTYQLKRKAARQAVVAGQVVRYGTDYVTPRTLPAELPEETPAATETRSLLELAAEKLYDAGPPAHRVWLPPLDVPPTLDELLPPLTPHPQYGLTVDSPSERGTLRVPVGVIDRPFQQQREVMYADMSGAGGHVGIAGAPQSGKSNVLRTLITGLALTHTAAEVQFYCLDFGGGTMSALRGLPHIAGITGRHDPERVVRTIAEVNSIITRRERSFAERGIDSITAFRKLKAAGELPDEPNGDVFLVIDGWNTVRQEFPDLVPVLALISQRGLNYGVHLMIATSRWGELSGALRDQLQTRFELRLGDAVDSQINMRAAQQVPKFPGRGLTDDKMHFLTALPRMDGSGTTDDLGEGIADLVDAVSDHWQGPRAPQVRMLPISLDAADLPAPRGALQIALGLEDQEISPLWHNFETDPHLMVVGDTESGKSNLMKLVAKSIMAAYTPAEARIMLVDFRRELYETVPESYRLGYAVSVDNVRQIVDGAARAMVNRVPSADITPAQLKKRDWWQGPELFVLVDDYDLISAGTGGHPFAPILEYLAQGTEIGLHLVVARGANGVARGLNDPLLRKIQEVNSPAVLLSCPPSEGVFFGGVKPRQLVPGRAFYITRRRTVQVQTGQLDVN